MTLARDASGEPSASCAGGHAWRPMSSLSLPCLAAGLPEICHRRSRRHPAFALPLPCPPEPEVSAFRCYAPPLGRGFRPFTGHKSCGLGAFAVSAALPIGQVLGLSGAIASRPPVSEPTCLRPRPPACRLRLGAWTDVTAILRIKTSGSSEPCGLPFRLSCVPKTGSNCA